MRLLCGGGSLVVRTKVDLVSAASGIRNWEEPPEPHPTNPVTSLQNSIADLLAQIQTAQTSRSLTADRTTATALSQLQTVVTSIQTTFNGFVSNGLANLPAALAGGFNSIMSGVQSALNNAGSQLGQLIAAGNSTSGASSIEVDQLNTATANLGTASTSWSSHVGSLLNQFSSLLTGIVDRLSGLPATLNGLFG
ncbi:uncharacterized protein LOC120413099 [Culex pipiens pallens]|uniref:uncharacterized protein LOC120413099 n=1 Tax=Culex pipiens pallens TaxID=42434 RepID=UPI001953419C|nr:uncharacterized protein LOC120413099 [Culex pipiens pallens]